jgi:TonB family protein
MTPLAWAVSEALVQFIWQGGLVTVLASFALFLLRKRTPNARYVVCCLALLALAVLPVITAFTLYDPLAANRLAPAAITLTIRAVWSGTPSPEKWLPAAEPWILRIWIFGVLFLSLRLAWLGTRIASLKRTGGSPDKFILTLANALARRIGMTRAVRILVSAVPDGPGVIGWFRPVILLPAATILNLTTDQLEAILAHEIVHLHRYDDLVNIAQTLIETLLFYHPAVWWLSNRIRLERELCCDDLAVRASSSALCYARALTSLERLRVSPPRLALAATGSPLEYRIRRILLAHEQNPASARVPGTIVLALMTICLALYSLPAQSSTTDPPARVQYPESARLQGIEGTVPVQLQIDNAGAVSEAKAIGGPRELRQAAVQSASALRFPESPATTERVDVAFQLTPSSPPPQPLPSQNRAEAIERILPKQSDLHLLLAAMGAAYGKTDPAVLEAGHKAALQLDEHFGEYFGDRQKPQAKTFDLQIHSVLAWIAQIEKDDATAETELKKVLAVDPDDAGTSYALGSIIMHEAVAGNELARYSEAIYDFARSLTVTGPNALPADIKAAAEAALKDTYGSYHGSTDGLDDLLRQVGASALPPANFHIARADELSPWEATKSRLLERGDAYFASIKDKPLPQTIEASVVMQLSPNRILVNTGDAPEGDAVLRLDAANYAPVRPGTVLRFHGVVDSYTSSPYTLTLVIIDPKEDISGLSTKRKSNIVARIFKGFVHLVRHLA